MGQTSCSHHGNVICIHCLDVMHLYITMIDFYPERFTELHGEEKREEGNRGDQEEKRGNQKGREQASQ